MRRAVGVVALILSSLLVATLGDQEPCFGGFMRAQIGDQAYCYLFIRYGSLGVKADNTAVLAVGDVKCQVAGPEEPHAHLFAVETERERQIVDHLFLDVQSSSNSSVKETSAFLLGVRISGWGREVRVSPIPSTHRTDLTFIRNKLRIESAKHGRCVYYSHSLGFFVGRCGRLQQAGSKKWSVRYIACKYMPRYIPAAGNPSGRLPYPKVFPVRAKRQNDPALTDIIAGVVGKFSIRNGSDAMVKATNVPAGENVNSNIGENVNSNIDVQQEPEVPLKEVRVIAITKPRRVRPSTAPTAEWEYEEDTTPARPVPHFAGDGSGDGSGGDKGGAGSVGVTSSGSAVSGSGGGSPPSSPGGAAVTAVSMAVLVFCVVAPLVTTMLAAFATQ